MTMDELRDDANYWRDCYHAANKRVLELIAERTDPDTGQTWEDKFNALLDEPVTDADRKANAEMMAACATCGGTGRKPEVQDPCDERMGPWTSKCPDCTPEPQAPAQGEWVRAYEAALDPEGLDVWIRQLRSCSLKEYEAARQLLIEQFNTRLKPMGALSKDGTFFPGQSQPHKGDTMLYAIAAPSPPIGGKS